MMIGAFYRNMEEPTRIVQILRWDDHVVIVKHIDGGELEDLGEIPFPYHYFINAYELDG